MYKNSKGKQINVAIGVIHYNDQYLLGFRNGQQHQGNRYEFVGGKIEPHERPDQALIREVKEEVGLIIDSTNVINQLGVLNHTYVEQKVDHITWVKKVCLHVFRVTLSQQQYQQLIIKNEGCEGQTLKWVSLKSLVEGQYKLPDANKSILEWLKLPNTIVITYDLLLNALNVFDNDVDKTNDALAIFEGYQSLNDTDILTQWLVFHSEKLPHKGCVYVRLKRATMEQQRHAIIALIEKRPDLQLIINKDAAAVISEKMAAHGMGLPKQIIAQHLTHNQLTTLVKDKKTLSQFDSQQLNLPIVVSCHDVESIQQANTLAQQRIEEALSPVVGAFISPIAVTQSHPNHKPLGYEKFAKLAEAMHVPVIGLGGLEPSNLITVRQHGGDKVAGIRHFMT